MRSRKQSTLVFSIGLSNFFNERILKQEQELYEKEGLGVEKITYVDNQDCIDLFERRGSGMLDLLDEEMRLPKPLPIHFTSAVHEANKKHFRLDTPRKSLLKEHRGMRDDDGLLVRHFAGTVCYETAQFIEKNNDALHASLEAIFETSNTPLIKELFEQSLESSVFSQNRGKKLVVPSVGSKFRSQLTLLLEKLNTTGTHFVRCVKPNSSMSAWIFEGSSVLSQLRCAGMGSVLKLMQSGYPSRTGFSELYNMYSPVLPPELARLDPRLFCKCLFHVLGLNNRDFKFGMTKVFFRPAKFAEFDQLLRRDPENMKVLVKKVKVWLITVRWRKAQYGAWSVIKLKNKILYRREQLTTIQKYLRGYLTRQKHAKRLALFRKSNGLQARGTEMKKIVDQLTPQSRQKWEIEVVDSQRQLANLVQQCKNQRMEIDACARSYEECLRRVDKIIHDLKGQLASDEAIKLAEIEQKMREEREQEAKKQREEIMKGKEMERNEMRRKEIEVERVRAERDFEKNRAVEASREIAAIEEMQRKRAREEQERLDAQLAARLAAEEGTLADLPASTSWNSSTSSGNNNQKRGKHDLSTWKYAELRDTINTSNDMELLLACKEEFHRRLRIYNEWKQKNASEKERVEEARRVPLALMNPQQTNDTMRWIGASGASRNSATLQVNPALSAQRFFKVPFSSRLQQNGKNPAVFFVETGSQQGVWYGHFNGQWIQRQIELHPDKPPILLLAGRDDLQMCELPLDQTQLPLKKGAEILEHEFETIWAHLGGKPLAKWNP
ncbi:unnamed protein product, partial [Mesorhabditis belari]|uniref:Myosin motor domain-containing protein n=1 Tax=Mesorhabditis belari TaxID=2138241 RepID=A0AAF3F1V2_9BILA